MSRQIYFGLLAAAARLTDEELDMGLARVVGHVPAIEHLPVPRSRRAKAAAGAEEAGQDIPTGRVLRARPPQEKPAIWTDYARRCVEDRGLSKAMAHKALVAEIARINAESLSSPVEVPRLRVFMRMVDRLKWGRI